MWLFGLSRKGRGGSAPQQANTFDRITPGGRDPSRNTYAEATRGDSSLRSSDRSSARRNGYHGSSSLESGPRRYQSPPPRRHWRESPGRGRRNRWASDGSAMRVTDGLVLFWKEPACFAQWTPSSFVIGDTAYCNAEQWMMANKAKLFSDEETRARIMNTEDPREHKRLGRLVKNFDPEVWESVGYDLVVQGNLEKFRQNILFQRELLATGDKILAEASPFDTKWGIGLSADHPDALNQRKWPGKNELGEALMDVRARIKEDIYNQQRVGAEDEEAGAEAAEASAAEGDSMDVDEDYGEDYRLYKAR